MGRNGSRDIAKDNEEGKANPSGGRRLGLEFSDSFSSHGKLPIFSLSFRPHDYKIDLISLGII